MACCSPLPREPLTVEQAEQVAPLLKALADPVRLRLLSLVASHADGEACVCDLADAFDLSQPTISHHLKVLHDLDLLERYKRGVWVYYRVRAAGPGQPGRPDRRCFPADRNPLRLTPGLGPARALHCAGLLIVYRR